MGCIYISGKKWVNDVMQLERPESYKESNHDGVGKVFTIILNGCDADDQMMTYMMMVMMRVEGNDLRTLHSIDPGAAGES